MRSDTADAPSAARLLYPELPSPLTPVVLQRLFCPSYDEREWAPAVARTPASHVALLVQLKTFQVVGRFLRAEEIPGLIVGHIAARLGVEGEIGPSDSTLYRHRTAVLKRLGVTAWGGAARPLARRTMIAVAEARTGPAELINAAVDALVRCRFELPSLDTVRRLAANVHRQVNATQWQRIGARLDDGQRGALEALLVVDPATQESPFALLCRAPGRASRRNLNALIDRYQWLTKLPDATAALQGISGAKVLQWANEARRLKAPELREYIAPRRQALLLAVIRHARGQVLDDLTQMLRLARKIEWKSEQRLEEWYRERQSRTDSLIRAFHESLVIHGSDDDPGDKVVRLEALFAGQGGREQLRQDCADHLRHDRQNWRPFARAAFVPLRSSLLRVADILPLQGTSTSRDLLSLIMAVTGDEPPCHRSALWSRGCSA